MQLAEERDNDEGPLEDPNNNNLGNNIVPAPAEDNQSTATTGSIPGHENKPQDQSHTEIFHHNHNNSSKSTRSHAYMNLVKGYVGSGILALPYAFNEAGWFLSICIFIGVAVIVYETMHLLFDLADSFEKDNIDYAYLARHHFGSKGVFAVKSFIVIFQTGCCISYVIFFLKFLENVFDIVGAPNQHDEIYLILALVIILPMTFINDISKLAKVSIAANIMIMVTLIAIFIYNWNQVSSISHDEFTNNLSNMADFGRIPMLIGVSIYSFEAIGLIFSIRNSLHNPQQTFSPIFRNVNGLMVILYISFSVLAVLAYGDNVKEILLFNLPNDKPDVQFFQILYAFALLFSYPLQLLPSFHVIEDSKIIKQFIFKQQFEQAGKNYGQDSNPGVVQNDKKNSNGKENDGIEGKNQINNDDIAVPIEEPKQFQSYPNNNNNQQFQMNINFQGTVPERQSGGQELSQQQEQSLQISSNDLSDKLLAFITKSKLWMQSPQGRRAGIRITITLMICFLAYAIPRFAVFLNIIGAVAGTSLQFAFPIIMYLQTFKHTITKNKKYKLIVYFVIGLLGGLSSLVYSFVSLMQTRAETL